MDDELDLKCLANFLALVDERHYGRAAAKVHLTRSALTKRIQRLEAGLGVLLFERGSAGVVALTPAGARLARQAGPLLAHSGAVRRAVMEKPTPYTIRLGVPGAVGQYPRPQQLLHIQRRLNKCYPDVEVVCVGVPYDATVTWLLEGRVDVMWTAGESGNTTLEHVDLAPMKRAAIVPKGHKLAAMSAIPVDAGCALPIVRNAVAPAGWMDVFCLNDVRPIQKANIIDIDARSAAPVLQLALKTGAVIVAHEGLAEQLSPRLQMRALLDAPLVSFQGVRRRADRRDPLLTLLAIMRDVASTPVKIGYS